MGDPPITACEVSCRVRAIGCPAARARRRGAASPRDARCASGTSGPPPPSWMGRSQAPADGVRRSGACARPGGRGTPRRRYGAGLRDPAPPDATGRAGRARPRRRRRHAAGSALAPCARRGLRSVADQQRHRAAGPAARRRATPATSETIRSPVSRSRQAPLGSCSAVSPQPLGGQPGRQPGRHRTTPPRSKATTWSAAEPVDRRPARSR